MPFALTFDDGGISFYTLIADRLEALGWRAHCFVPTDIIGRPGFLTRAQIQELDRRGHHIGSHSASHPARISACIRQTTSSTNGRAAAASCKTSSAVRWRPHQCRAGSFQAASREPRPPPAFKRLMTSEPVTRPHYVAYCRVLGRFALRHYNRPEFAARLVDGAPWARWAAWADWNAKALIKPILGTAYGRVADWLMAQKAAAHSHTTTQEK